MTLVFWSSTIRLRGLATAVRPRPSAACRPRPHYHHRTYSALLPPPVRTASPSPPCRSICSLATTEAGITATTE
jgi:hypothetical protein